MTDHHASPRMPADPQGPSGMPANHAPGTPPMPDIAQASAPLPDPQDVVSSAGDTQQSTSMPGDAAAIPAKVPSPTAQENVPNQGNVSAGHEQGSSQPSSPMPADPQAFPLTADEKLAYTHTLEMTAELFDAAGVSLDDSTLRYHCSKGNLKAVKDKINGSEQWMVYEPSIHRLIERRRTDLKRKKGQRDVPIIDAPLAKPDPAPKQAAAPQTRQPEPELQPVAETTGHNFDDLIEIAELKATNVELKNQVGYLRAEVTDTRNQITTIVQQFPALGTAIINNTSLADDNQLNRGRIIEQADGS